MWTPLIGVHINVKQYPLLYSVFMYYFVCEVASDLLLL